MSALRTVTDIWLVPGCSLVKNLPANAGDTGSIPGLGRSPRRGNGNPLQYSCLGNPMDGGTWHAAVHRVAKSRTRPNTAQQQQRTVISIILIIVNDLILCVFLLYFPVDY